MVRYGVITVFSDHRRAEACSSGFIFNDTIVLWLFERREKTMRIIAGKKWVEPGNFQD